MHIVDRFYVIELTFYFWAFECSYAYDLWGTSPLDSQQLYTVYN